MAQFFGSRVVLGEIGSEPEGIGGSGSHLRTLRSTVLDSERGRIRNWAMRKKVHRREADLSGVISQNPVSSGRSFAASEFGPFSEWRVIRPEQAAPRLQSTRCRQASHVDWAKPTAFSMTEDVNDEECTGRSVTLWT